MDSLRRGISQVRVIFKEALLASAVQNMKICSSKMAVSLQDLKKSI